MKKLGQETTAAAPEKTPGEQKVDEYVARALRGVPLGDILQDLGPHFTSEIVSRLQNQSELPDFLQEELSELGYSKQGRSDEGVADTSLESISESRLDKLVEFAMGQFQSEAAKNLIKEQYERRNESGYRQLLANSLFGACYKKYREAEYPFEENEQKIWEQAVRDSDIDHIEQNGWTYRGVFKNKEKAQETETRASLNVTVTPELLSALDDLIKRGEFVGNYKFGEPGSRASAVERHDSITLYFLETPSDAVLHKISELAKPYVRGNNLLGKKVAEGFYLSEIGSVQEEHIQSFIEELQHNDPEFSQAVRNYTTRKGNKGSAMSEAQYYAIKDVAQAFGYSLNYSNTEGFELGV